MNDFHDLTYRDQGSSTGQLSARLSWPSLIAASFEAKK
jgi:hypothetical protein